MRTTEVHDDVGTASTWIVDRPVRIGPYATCGRAPASTGTKRPTAGCETPHEDERLDPEASRNLAALEDRLTAALREPDLGVLPEVNIADFAYWVHEMQRSRHCGLRP